MELFTWTISAPREERVVFCRKEDGVYTLTAGSLPVGAYRRSRPGHVTVVNEPVVLYGRSCRFVVWPGMVTQPDLIVDGQSLEKGTPFREAWMAARVRSIALSLVVLVGVLALTWLWHTISQPAPVWYRVGEGAVCGLAAVIVARRLWQIRRERIALFDPNQ
jgi:hypothetical protein